MIKKIIPFKKNKFVLIFREDHLLREVCTHLFLNGVEGRFFSQRKIDKNINFDKSHFLKIKKLLFPVVNEFTKRWVKKKLSESTRRIIF